MKEELKYLAGNFFFDPQDKIYQFHFPGKPVVPGSVIIQAFLEANQKQRPSCKVKKIGSFRFNSFVTPGECQFLMELKGKSIKCKLFKDHKTLAKGVLEL